MWPLIEHARQIIRRSQNMPRPSAGSWIIAIGGLLTFTCAATLVLWTFKDLPWPSRIVLLALCASILTIPFFFPRKLIATWLIFVFTAGLWFTAFNLGGKFSWWNVGFAFGTIKHTQMELAGDVQSTLGSYVCPVAACRIMPKWQIPGSSCNRT